MASFLFVLVTFLVGRQSGSAFSTPIPLVGVTPHAHLFDGACLPCLRLLVGYIGRQGQVCREELQHWARAGDGTFCGTLQPWGAFMETHTAETQKADEAKSSIWCVDSW